MNEKKFKIDFTEFSFLVEACIPPRPIARSMFWNDVINKYYYEMTSEERERLYEWINRNGGYKNQLEKKNEQCLIFEARFNPNNQFLVYVKEEKNPISTFLFNDKYYIYNYHSSRAKWVDKEHILKIEKNETNT